MNKIVPGLLFLLIICGCAKDTLTNTQQIDNTCDLQINTERKINFVMTGSGYTNTVVDFSIRAPYWDGATVDPNDTLIGGTLLILSDSSFYYERRVSNATSGVKLGKLGYNMQIDVDVPRVQSGDYLWGKKTLGGTVGISIKIGTSPLDDYLPFSGKTNIQFSKSRDPSNGVPDTVFGSFCGTLKNAFGDSIVVHDGKFFYDGFR